MSKQDRDKGAMERAGEAMGEMAGRMMGRTTDAAMNVTGAVFNSMAAMLGQWWSGPDAQQAATSFGEQQDQQCRHHFEARSSGRDYTTTRPLYQLGHVAGKNPEYQHRSYRDVEPDLRRAWESSPDSTRYGRWDDVSAFVKFGFDQGGSGGSAGASGQADQGGSASANRQADQGGIRGSGSGEGGDGSRTGGAGRDRGSAGGL